MPLTSGERIGPYEILGPLGAGGMGEVYRARDTKLNRDVAIKVLPAALASDADYLARFQREAQALAALHHPNIATIFGLEQNAIVMELVEGQTLKGPIPLSEALHLAKQIAEALEAAHDKNIVHRDLKPGNIIVTPDGVVKVLDFGLAKTAAKSAVPPTANSPTLSMRPTDAGLILGTASYMSPEQASGQSVDRRADIWSFGVVLHELLTGKRLFNGETISHTLADVLRTPVDFDLLPTETPRGIRDLLKRCLDRDVKARLRDIGEARVAIQTYLANPVEETEPSRARPSSRQWVATSAMALALASLAFLHFLQKPPPLPVISSTLLAPDAAEFDFNAPFGMPAISPDGTRLVFAAKTKDSKTQLWLRRLDSTTAQPLPDTENAATPFWSPDSQWIAFGQENKLKKIDIRGGASVAITDLSNALRGGSWNSAGIIVFGLNSTGTIWQVAASGGKATLLIDKGTHGGAQRHPWFLPDGRHFLFSQSTVEGNLVLVGSLDEPGKPGRVVAQANGPAVFAQGFLLYLRDDTLVAQPFDTTRLETTGDAVQLAEGIPTYSTGSRIAAFAASPQGLLLHQGGGTFGRSRLVWKDRQGKTLSTFGEIAGEIRGVAWSPDQKRVAVHIRDRADSEDLWIYDDARGLPTRFTFDPKRDREEVWSPDGTIIYFTSNRKGPAQDLYRKASNGSGADELLFGDGKNKTANSVSPDGKWLLYTNQSGDETRQDLLALPLTALAQGKPEPRKIVAGVFGEQNGQFSPDGQWIAYISDEVSVDTSRRSVYVQPFSGTGGKKQISAGSNASDDADFPRWRRDGKEIFFATRNGNLMAAEVSIRNGTIEIGKVQKLFDGIIMTRYITYDVSADGQRFLVVDDGPKPTRPLTLVQNWAAGLKH